MPSLVEEFEKKVKELEEKRLAVTTERLVKKEGIQEKRLLGGSPKRSATGEGAAGPSTTWRATERPWAGSQTDWAAIR